MKEIALFACRNVRDPRWQLGGAPATGSGWTLIGWKVVPSPVDAGVPAEVATVLTEALASISRVTFPCSTRPAAGANDWSPQGPDFVRTVAAGSVAGIIRSMLTRTPPDIILISTRDPETVACLFDDAAYPWWLQGTFALLSDPDGPPPEVDWRRVVALLSEPAAPEATAAVDAVLRPAVDGDVVGVLSSTPEFERRLLDELARLCSVRGMDWQVVPEDEFIIRLS